MSNYIPTRIFKFIEPTTVEQIFRKCGVPMPDVRLDASGRCREALQDAWKETKASARGALAVARLDEVFQDISRYIAETGIILPVCFERRELLTHRGVATGISATQYDVFHNFNEWTIDLE